LSEPVPAVPELETAAELQRFFVDFVGPRAACVFRGIPFVVEYREKPHPLWLGVNPLLYGILDALKRLPYGLYVVVPLPAPLRANAFVAWLHGINDGLAGTIADRHLEATDPDEVRRYLADGLGETLDRLSARHSVFLTDREVRLGPLLGRPEDSARDVAALLAALPAPGPEEAAEFDADEAFARETASPVAVAVLGRMDAEILRGALEADDIPCRLLGAQGSALWGDSGGAAFAVQVVVPASFAERAGAIAASFREGGAAPTD
jgi:hypothetical protein